METIIVIIAAGIIGYILIAAKFKLPPWSGSVIGVVKPNEREALIATLVHTTYPVNFIFPKVRSLAPLSPNMKEGIIAAFRERTATAQTKFGWTNGLNPADYEILVFPSVRDHNADGVYSPVFQVFIEPSSSYDNSIYDQEPGLPGGWIFAAEQVLTRGDDLTNVFVIAMNDDADYSQRATSYALDHLFPYHNDRPLYEATKDHSKGGGHPLW